MNGKIYQWIIGVAVTVSLASGFYLLNRVDRISEAKVSLESYRQEQAALCNRLDRMEDKIDKILSEMRGK